MNVGMQCGPYSHKGKGWSIGDLEMVGQIHPDHITEEGHQVSSTGTQTTGHSGEQKMTRGYQ